MRKVSNGMTRQALALQSTLKGLRLLGAPGAGRLVMTLPQSLMRLMGWQVGQRLKWQVSERGVTLSAPKSAHAPARKRSGPGRVRFERRWQAALRDSQRQRQGWAIVKNTGVPS